MPDALYRYEACIEGPAMTVRYLIVQATGIRSAYALAKKACAEGELVRGVNPIDDEGEL